MSNSQIRVQSSVFTVPPPAANRRTAASVAGVTIFLALQSVPSMSNAQHLTCGGTAAGAELVG